MDGFQTSHVSDEDQIMNTSDPRPTSVQENSQKIFYHRNMSKKYKDSVESSSFADLVKYIFGQISFGEKYRIIDIIEDMEEKFLSAPPGLSEDEMVYLLRDKHFRGPSTHIYVESDEYLESDSHDFVSQGIPITENWVKARRLYRKFTER